MGRLVTPCPVVARWTAVPSTAVKLAITPAAGALGHRLARAALRADRASPSAPLRRTEEEEATDKMAAGLVALSALLGARGLAREAVRGGRGARLGIPPAAGALGLTSPWRGAARLRAASRGRRAPSARFVVASPPARRFSSPSRRIAS